MAITHRRYSSHPQRLLRLSPFPLLSLVLCSRLLTSPYPSPGTHLHTQGAWSDGESAGPGAMAAFDGQGSGDDFGGVSLSYLSFPFIPPLNSLVDVMPGAFYNCLTPPSSGLTTKSTPPCPLLSMLGFEV